MITEFRIRRSIGRNWFYLNHFTVGKMDRTLARTLLEVAELTRNIILEKVRIEIFMLD